MKRLLKRLGLIAGIGLATIIILPILLVGFLTAKVWIGQPDLNGNRIAPGLAATTTLSRDALGVVHIKAANEHDAYFGLGYAHAQDRFFQMDAMRRIAWGRLAETAGSSALPLDIRMRRLCAGRLAEGDAAILPPAMRSIYQAYANGVNAWLTTRKGVAADELTLLLTGEPEPWKIEHSLAWNRLMALRLVTNWGSELMRLRLAKNLPTEQLADLWPSYPVDSALTVPNVPVAALEAAQAFAELSNSDDGSNAWAVSPEASATGKGLLANDPHLGLATPGVWYLARIEAPGLVLAGATAPGVPAMVLGHNGHVAWGLTNATTDTSDVYVETIDPDDPTRYLAPNGPKPFEKRTERITVRFGDTIDLRVRTTRHGPVISDEDSATSTGTVLALAHTGFLPGERSSETLYWINRARSWRDMLTALTFTTGPQQNVFYAGPDGVGMATGGALPI
ncbi:MAG: penicillin acylase family protein, partial [Alphaproteobacteria bacterium]